MNKVEVSVWSVQRYAFIEMHPCTQADSCVNSSFKTKHTHREVCVVVIRGLCAPSMPFPVITAVKRRSAEIQSELSTKAASFVLEIFNAASN